MTKRRVVKKWNSRALRNIRKDRKWYKGLHCTATLAGMNFAEVYEYMRKMALKQPTPMPQLEKWFRKGQA